ncbi:protein DMP9-like [Prosopis cineraria]|uniref:protein DMP9-like n=1 Tax=Prosopis cineraria TaxID=364024 RepID=UPI00240F7A81|nr:protein DMP9-like [Prosopis cineraria]
MQSPTQEQSRLLQRQVISGKQFLPPAKTRWPGCSDNLLRPLSSPTTSHRHHPDLQRCPPYHLQRCQCSSLSTVMMKVVLGLCTTICFFTQFHRQLPRPRRQLVYGFVLPNGLKVFKPDPDVQVPKDDKYRLEFADFVHAVLSVVVFLAIAFSDQRVIDCLFPRKADDVHNVMDTLS